MPNTTDIAGTMALFARLMFRKSKISHVPRRFAINLLLEQRFCVAVDKNLCDLFKIRNSNAFIVKILYTKGRVGCLPGRGVFLICHGHNKV